MSTWCFMRTISVATFGQPALSPDAGFARTGSKGVCHGAGSLFVAFLFCLGTPCLYGLVALLVIVSFLPFVAPAWAQDTAVMSEPGESERSRAWIEMLRERSYPADLLDGPTLATLYNEAQQPFTKRAARLATSVAWEPIGPSSIAATLFAGAGSYFTYSGRVVSIAVDPADPNHWLIGADNGGIWETHDSGCAWTVRTDDQPSLAAGAIAFASGDPRVVYAGNFSGLLKSSDGGASWQIAEQQLFAGRNAAAFAISPANPDIVVAALDDRFNFFPDLTYGVYRSTDGGITWTQRLSGLSASALVADPRDFQHQYAAVGRFNGGTGHGIYRSFDGGSTWVALSGPWGTAVGQTRFAIAESAPDTLYAQIQDATLCASGGSCSTLLGIWKTTNAWATTPTWTAVPLDTSAGFGPFVVDPTNPTVLYRGEVDLRRYDGVAWTTITGDTHVDLWGLAWAGSGRLVVTNDGGVFSTDDGGRTFANHNTDLQITEFYWVLSTPPIRTSRWRGHKTNRLTCGPGRAVGGSLTGRETACRRHSRWRCRTPTGWCRVTT